MKPSFEEFRKLSKQGTLIPLIHHLPLNGENLLSCYEKVGSPPLSYILEGLDAWGSKGRYGFLGWDPFLRIAVHESRAELHSEKRSEISDGVTDPLPLLRRCMRAFRPVRSADLPRFQGGLVGYLNYEMVRKWEHLPCLSREHGSIPEGTFLAAGRLIVLDRKEDKATAVVLVPTLQDDDLAALYEKGCSKLEDTIRALTGAVQAASSPESLFISEIRPNMERGAFEQAVLKAKAYIHKGDIFQVVLSQRFSAQCQGRDLLLYQRLRQVNFSPYMFYLNVGDVRLIGSSPETLIRIQGDTVTLRPIAGTRRRGVGEEEDRTLEAELLADPKERAEHVMLVDLGRNDVGRVSSPGSVRVSRFMDVERYSHVMHIVSEVEGRLRPGLDCYDAFRAAFPAGTVSGAPKIRALEIIAELEPGPRGPYAGAVGYFGFNGDADFCITIRTIVIEKDHLFVQAGAGIVFDSSPPTEYEETLQKASALLKVLQGAEDDPVQMLRGGDHAPAHR